MPLVHRRDCIILSTIDVIHESGIQGLSIRSVAKKQNISEAAIFKHFRSKNELLLAVLEHLSQFDSDIGFTSQVQHESKQAGLLYLVDTYVTLYENYPPMTSLLFLFEALRHDPELAEAVQHIRQVRLHHVRTLFDEGKARGEWRQNIDSDAMAHILMGYVREVILSWRMEGCMFPLRRRVMEGVLQFVNTLT